jgi:hypothetical protein
MADKKAKKPDSAMAMLDKRVMDRMLTKGALSRTDVEQYLKSLPDLTDQADNIADKVYGQDGR